MLITSHTLATLLVGKTLSLEGPELYVALLAGVGVDIDHIFVDRQYIQDRVRNIGEIMRGQKIATRGVKQHSWLQEPLFGTIAGLAIGIVISYFWLSVRWWIFPLFLLLHIAMDGIMRHNYHEPFAPFSRYKYQGWIRPASKIELLISVVGLIILSIALLR